MSRSSKSTPPPEFTDEPELLAATPVGEGAGTPNEINLKVQHAQEQLLDLKRQQEEIERQKRELEELSRKQREFDEGRREIVEKLTRGIILLERQDFEVKRELEQIKIVHDSFTEQLQLTEGLNPADVTAEDLAAELTKSLARVDQAKSVYNQSRARLVSLRESEDGTPLDIPDDLMPTMAEEEKSFGAMVREGFAYTLPLILFSIFILIAYFLLRH